MKFFTFIGYFILWCCVIVQAGFAENLSLTIEANDYHITRINNGFSKIEMADFGAIPTPGKPQLPAKTFMIAVPPGAHIQHVDIQGDAPVQIEGRYKIQPVKPSVKGRISEYGFSNEDYQTARQEWQNNFDNTYTRNFNFPEQIGSYLGQGQWRKYTYVRVRFYPIQFNPKSGRLLYYPSCTVSIDYTLPVEGSPEWQRIQPMLSDDVLDDIISTRLINFSEAQSWYQPFHALQPASQQYDYVIIVRDQTMRNALATFRQWKEKIGHRVKIVTTDSIFAHVSSADEAEQIRDFLKSKYLSEQWGIRYVLLVGDIDELPIRYLFPSDTEWPYVSDYYYAKLSKSINSDGDEHFGEFKDDNLDPTADVLVGRIPCNQASAVIEICKNIISFEQDTGAWKRHILMPMGVMDYNSSGKTDGAVLAEYLKSNILNLRGWSATTLYEKNGLDSSSYTCDYPLSNTNVIGRLGTKRQSVVNSVAHGCPSAFASQVWTKDINHNNRCDRDLNELAYTLFNKIENIPAYLESVAFLCGCSTGPLCGKPNFDITSSWQLNRQTMRSLGKTYIINGAPAVIASTAGGDYGQNWSHPNDGAMQSLDYYFFDQFINKDKPAGDAYYAAMLEYVNKHNFQRGIRVFNFYGDPSLILKGFDLNPGGTDVAIHDNRSWGFAADNDANGDMYAAVIASDNNSDGDVKIYKSIDHGQTWSVWNSISTRGAIYDVEVIVAKYGSDEFVDNRLLVFYTTSGGVIYVTRFPLAGGVVDNVIIASEGGNNAPREITAARDPKTGFFNLYLAYESRDWNTGNTSVKTARSGNNGFSWQDWDSFPDYHSPSVDAGPDQHVYIACKYQSIPYDIYVFRSTDAGENWSTNQNLTAHFGNDGYGDPVVAASTDPARPTVWVAYRSFNNSKFDIRYTFSKDGGNNWDTEYTLGINTDINCSLHMKGYQAAPNQWMNIVFTNTLNKTQVFWRYSNGSNPDAWSSPRIVNDFEAAGFQSLPPRIVYSPGAAGTGSGVIYAGKDRVYFTAPWLTNQTLSFQNENPTKKQMTIEIELQQKDYVTVMIHNSVGEIVRTLDAGEMTAGKHILTWDGKSNADAQALPGVYLAAVRTSRFTSCKKLLIGFEDKNHATTQAGTTGWIETGDLEQAVTVSSLIATDETKLYAAAAMCTNEAANQGAVYQSVNNGEQWERMGGLEACWSLSSICQAPDGALLTGGIMLVKDQARGVIYRSENGGQSWKPVLMFPDGFVTDIFRAEDNSLYAATGWNGMIAKSENDGVEWFPIAELGGQVNVYCIMQASNGFLLAGVEQPNHTGQILWSEDTGEHWTPAQGLDGVLAVYDIIEVGDKLYAGVRGNDMGWVYQSETGGQSWTKTSELEDTNILAVHSLLEVRDSHGHYILAGTEMMQGPSSTKVYKKELQQYNWEIVGHDLDLANTVYALAKTEQHIFAGTGYIYGNVYRTDRLITKLDELKNQTLPVQYNLSQNYPNPFNPQTSIEFEVPKLSHVNVEIFNLQGQLIRTLFNEEKSPGAYSVNWDGKNDLGEEVTTGIYLYTIIAGDFKASKKMILMK